MNALSKIGLIINIFAFLIMIILMFLLHEKVPNFIVYLFNGGLVLTFVGSIILIRKNKQP